MQSSLSDKTSYFHSLAPQTIATDTTTNGSGVNLAGNDVYNSAAFVVHTGSYTDGTFTFAFQESTDGGSSWSDIADADLDGSEPVVDASGDADSTFVVGYLGTADDVRIQVVSTSTSSGAAMSGLVACGDARSEATV